MRFFYLFLLVAQSFGFELYWFGTSNLLVKSSSANILFDPFFNRAGILDTFLFEQLRPSKEVTEKWLSRSGVANIDAQIINHSHFDHILDVGSAYQKFNGKVYASSNGVKLAQNLGVRSQDTFRVFNQKSFSVGNVKVTPFKSSHTPHFFFGHIFMKGKVTKSKAPTSPWDYKLDDLFCYLLEFDNKKVLFWLTSMNPTPEQIRNFKDVDVLVLGIAQTDLSEKPLKHFLLTAKPKIVIPVHFDNFFKPLREELEVYPWVDLTDYKTYFAKVLPKTKFLIPVVGRKFVFE